MGKRILLVYYYLWHFLASHLRLIAGVTGWQADVALTWFTASSTISFLCLVAMRLSRRTLAAFFVLLLALRGPLWSSESNLLP
ncbi:MAG: hypothetical protein HY718_07920, partial [Planctomycetes bacterium]|nr:hypothetical protein [Planctomycetota bacterium]